MRCGCWDEMTLKLSWGMRKRFKIYDLTTVSRLAWEFEV
jgi:hypothetical protein